MPTNTESLNRELFRLLSKYKPKPLDAEGKATPIPDEADIFKFEFTKDGEDYGTVYVTLDEDRVLTVYFGDDVTESPDDKTPGVDYDDTWSGLLHQLSAWRMTKGLKGFNTQNKDRVGDDMARRNHMRNKDKIAEGYYPMGKRASYSDAVPSVKIVIEHSRVIEEGEQRYRNINRIFLENQAGERYLLDTKKPGIARVYARHIAEGGKVNDDRWSHIGSLCEEYQKMAGFVRATRNGQFNESAQALVNEGLEHYASLRESLSRMTGKRGYNTYFESWTPSLMEAEGEENNLNELFVQETLDPRIESVMPILNRIHKKVSESTIDKEMNKLAEWADSLSEAEGESLTSNNPVGIPEGTGSSFERILAAHPEAVENFKQGGDLDYDLESDLWAYYFDNGEIRNYDADASEFISQRLADELGLSEGSRFEKEEGVAEDLDANQKRVGQLGPTEKITKSNPLRGKLVGANENFINTVDQAVTTEEVNESEERPYVCVHAKKGKCEVKASSSYQAAQKAAQKWGLKGTAGIDAYLADVKHDASTLEEMDKSQPAAGRDIESPSGPDKEAKPVSKEKMTKDASDILNKAMDKEHKKEVKEGQDELDRILTIMNHRR